MISRRWWIAGLGCVLVSFVFTVVGIFLRASDDKRCKWDGLAIDESFQVRVFGPNRSQQLFCSVHCAELWVSSSLQSGSVRVFVTDETTGEEIPLEEAVLVRSTVVTNSVSGNRIHVFRNMEDARDHMNAAKGRVLANSERPFFGSKKDAYSEEARH